MSTILILPVSPVARPDVREAIAANRTVAGTTPVKRNRSVGNVVVVSRPTTSRLARTGEPTTRAIHSVRIRRPRRILLEIQGPLS